jgi:hypothetical protein
VAENSRVAQEYLDQASALRDQATELRKQALASGEPTAGAAPEGSGS